MNPVPDFSYFANRRWLDSLPHRASYSLVLLNGTVPDWEELMLDRDDSWLRDVHRITGIHHDVFLPYPVGHSGRWALSQHLRHLFQPVQHEMAMVCRRMGCTIQDLDLPEDWLSYLFANPCDAHYAAEHACQAMGIPTDVWPIILYWNHWHDRDVVVANPVAGQEPRALFREFAYRSTQVLARRLYLEDTDLEEAFNLREVGLMFNFKEALYEAASSFRRDFEDCVETILQVGNEPLANRRRGGLVEQYSERRAEIERTFRSVGARLRRHGGEHDIWEHPRLDRIFALPRHPVLSTGVARKAYRWASEARVI